MESYEILYQAALIFVTETKEQLQGLSIGPKSYLTTEITQLSSNLENAYQEKNSKELQNLSKQVIDIGQNLISLRAA